MTSQPDHDRPEEVEALRHLVNLDRDPADDCTEMVARLDFFLDGELTEQRRLLIQAHLDHCPSCYGAFDFEAELRLIVANRLRSHVPPNLADRIRRSLGGPQGGGPQGGGPLDGAAGRGGPFG